MYSGFLSRSNSVIAKVEISGSWALDQCAAARLRNRTRVWTIRSPPRVCMADGHELSAESRLAPKSSLTYLDKPEIDALLQAPDLRTPQGNRDYALLLFLYNTGARVEEAAHLTIDAINWSSSPAVRLVGKGNKTRSCPIWKRTVDMLKPLVAGRNAREFVFLNRLDEPLTRF